MPFPDEFCDTLSASGGFAMGTFAGAHSFGCYGAAGIPLGSEPVVRPFSVQQDLGALVENIDGELSLCGLTEFPRQDARQYCSCPGPVLFGAGDELAQAWHFPRKHRRQYDRMRFRDCLIQRATMK